MSQTKHDHINRMITLSSFLLPSEPVGVLVLHGGVDLVEVIAVGVANDGSEIFVSGLGSETFCQLGIGKETFRLVLNHSQNDL